MFIRLCDSRNMFSKPSDLLVMRLGNILGLYRKNGKERGHYYIIITLTVIRVVVLVIGILIGIVIVMVIV